MAILVIASILLLLFLYISFRKITVTILWIIGIAIILRIAMTASFFNIDNNDTRYHREIASLTLQGKNVFYVIDGPRSPYLPFLLYTQAGALLLERNTGIPLLFSLKLFFSMFDVGLVWLLYRITKGNRQAALLYAINPVSILITTVHGQFDIPALFFLVLAAYLLQKNKELPAAVAYTLGVVWKTWPILFIIPFIKHMKNKKYLLLIVLIPATLILFYSYRFHAPIYTIIRPLFAFRGGFGSWGPAMLLGPYLNNNDALVRALKYTSNAFLIVLFTVIAMIKPRRFLSEIFLILLVFFLISPAFGIQWTSWMIPFLIVFRPPLWRTLFMIFTLWIALAQTGWITPPGSPMIPYFILPGVVFLALFGWATVLLMFLNSHTALLSGARPANREILHSKKSRGK